MNAEPRFVTGAWEYCCATGRSGPGYLTAYEVEAWKAVPIASHIVPSGRPLDTDFAAVVSGRVMVAIVDRQAQLRSVPRFAVQQDSYQTPAGEVFPQLDRLSFDGNRVRVEYEHVLEPGHGNEPSMLRGTFHLQPDSRGHYHLDALGWMLRALQPASPVLRPVTASAPVDVDRAARRLVAAVERDGIPFDAALSTRHGVATAMTRRGSEPVDRTSCTSRCDEPCTDTPRRSRS